MTDLAKEVLNYLELTATGKQSALKINTIKVRFGVSRRTIEKITEELRENDVLLCSGSSGLYIATGLNEFMECYRSLQKRARKQFWHVSLMRKTAEKLGATSEQLSLNLFKAI